jgi:deoxyribonuclease-4
MDAAPELPLGICLDTAHAFHAGYEIHTEAGLAQTIAALDRTVGLARVAVLHVNDSKTPFASRVDRHEHIGRGHFGKGHFGKGKSGLEAFRRILNHPSLSASAATGRPGRAFLLETPIDAPGDDRRNVRRLWDLVGIPVKQAPRAQNGFSMMPRARRSEPAARPGPKRPARSRKSALASKG